VNVQSNELALPERRAARLWFGFGSTTAVLLFLTAVLVPRSGGVAPFDEDVMVSMTALRHPALTRVAQVITDLGTYRPVTVVSIGLALVLAYRTRRLLEPVVLLAAVEASSSLVDVLKVIIGRTRPPMGGMLGPPVFDSSFPSGHAASSTVVYVLGALLLAVTERWSSARRLLVAAGGCVMAGLIGLSRVYLGYHWLTDVVGSWLLAINLASIGMVFVTATQRPDWDAVPPDMVAPRDDFSRVPAVLSVANRTGRLVRSWSVGGPDSLMPETHWPQRLHHGPVERPAADRGNPARPPAARSGAPPVGPARRSSASDRRTGSSFVE
jgi:membrane-associated phospholipid phosphatase